MNDREELHEFIRNRIKQFSDYDIQIVQKGGYICLTHKDLDAPDAHKIMQYHELEFTQQSTWTEIEEWLKC